MLDAGAVLGRLILDDSSYTSGIKSGISANASLEKSIRSTVGSANNEFAKLGKSAKGYANTLNGLKDRQERLNKILGDVKIGTDRFKSLQTELNKTIKAIDQAQGATSNFSSILGGIGQGVAFGAIIGGLGMIATKAAKAGIEYEKLFVSFEVFTGSAKAATKLLDELTQYSIKTPFEPTEVNNAAKALLAFGVAADDILPSLDLIGNVAAGTGKDLKEMAVIFGQIRSTGKLTGQDLLQLINAGFNPLQIISEKTGKSMAKLKDEMEKGQISFKMVEKAFKDATSEGGRFFGMMDKQSQTTAGKLSTIAGNIDLFFQNLGTTINTYLGPAIDKIGELTNQLLKLQAVMGMGSGAQKLLDITNLTNEQLVKLSAGMRDFNNDMRAGTASFESLKKNLEGTGVSTEQFNNTFATTEDVLPKVAKQIEAISDRLKELQNPKKPPKPPLEELEKGTKKAKENLEKLGTTMQSVGSGPISSVTNSMVGLTRELGETANQFLTLYKMTGNIKFDQLAKTFGKLAEGAKKFGVYVSAVGPVLDGLVNNLTQGLENAIAAINRRIQEAGVATQVYSSLLQQAQAEEMANLEKQKQNEIDLFKKTEQAKIDALTASNVKQRELNNAEYAAKAAAMRAELDAFLAQERILFEEKQKSLLADAVLQGQEVETKRANEEDWVAFKKKEEAKLEDAILALGQDYDTKNSEADAAAQAEVEAKQQALNDNIQKMEEAKNKALEEKEKQHQAQLKAENKKAALYKWQLEKAALEMSKRVAVMQQGVGLASALMQATVAGIGVTANLAPFIGPFAVPAGLAVGLAMGALATSSYFKAVQGIQAQTVVPPAELFLASGGLVQGKGTSTSDSVRANLSNEEFVVNAERTKRIESFLDNAVSPDQVTNNSPISFMPGSIVVYGSMDDRLVRELGREFGKQINKRAF